MTSSQKLLQYRLKTFNHIYNCIQGTFPFTSNAQLQRFKKHRLLFEEKIKNLSADDRSFYQCIEQFVSKMRNSHTRIKWYPSKIIYLPTKYNVAFVQNLFWLFYRHRLIGRIISIDDLKPKQILKILSKYLVYSTKQSFMYRATPLLLGSLTNKTAKIIVAMTKRKRILLLKRYARWHGPTRSKLKGKIYRKNIRYVRIQSWQGDLQTQIDNEIRLLCRNKMKALIVDVRGNAGGNSKNVDYFVNHFFNKKVQFCRVRKRLSKTSLKLFSKPVMVTPQRPYLDIPIVILMDAGCLSSTEYFIAGLRDNNRAITAGEKTGGGSGNPKRFVIPYKNTHIELLVSTWLNYRRNGLPFEGKGIKTDIEVRQGLSALRQRRDLVLVRALDQLSGANHESVDKKRFS